MGQVLLQFLHLLQRCVFGLGVLQQTTHIEDVIQVGLDLHRQLVAFRMFAFLP